MGKIWLRVLAVTVPNLLYWAVFVVIAYSLLAGDAYDGRTVGMGETVAVWAAGLAIWLLGLWRFVRPTARRLTAGELAAARRVFGEAIDWDRVRVHARGFTPFQPDGIAVSPLGGIHFCRTDMLPDFSLSWDRMAWLIHELVHVWQYQTGVPVILRGLVERRYHYDALDPGKPLHRYGIEQQAAIVEDWFRRTQGVPAHRGSGSEADYRAVIPFLPG